MAFSRDGRSGPTKGCTPHNDSKAITERAHKSQRTVIEKLHHKEGALIGIQAKIVNRDHIWVEKLLATRDSRRNRSSACWSEKNSSRSILTATVRSSETSVAR